MDFLIYTTNFEITNFPNFILPQRNLLYSWPLNNTGLSAQSTYTQVFSHVKFYSTIQSAVGYNHGGRTMITKRPYFQRASYKLDQIFKRTEGHHS